MEVFFYLILNSFIDDDWSVLMTMQTICWTLCITWMNIFLFSLVQVDKHFRWSPFIHFIAFSCQNSIPHNRKEYLRLHSYNINLKNFLFNPNTKKIHDINCYCYIWNNNIGIKDTFLQKVKQIHECLVTSSTISWTCMHKMPADIKMYRIRWRLHFNNSKRHTSKENDRK